MLRIFWKTTLRTEFCSLMHSGTTCVSVWGIIVQGFTQLAFVIKSTLSLDFLYSASESDNSFNFLASFDSVRLHTTDFYTGRETSHVNKVCSSCLSTSTNLIQLSFQFPLHLLCSSILLLQFLKLLLVLCTRAM